MLELMLFVLLSRVVLLFCHVEVCVESSLYLSLFTCLIVYQLFSYLTIYRFYIFFL